MKSYTSVDQHINSFPPDIQQVLAKIRLTIQEALPEATERIAYGIPTYTIDKNIVHFCGYDKYVGFYPGSVGITAFKDDLDNYETSKGTVKFPYNKPIPYDLIRKITLYTSDYIQSKSK